MTLTAEERAVLAHMVVDVDAHVAHAVATVGEAAVRAKIARWRADYLAAVAAQGAGYKNRAQRQADEDAAEQAAREAKAAARAAEGLTRATAIATALNNAAVRGTQEQRDAFAKVCGVRPLTIPLGTDATAADIVSL